jgi:hypothetical protein
MGTGVSVATGRGGVSARCARTGRARSDRDDDPRLRLAVWRAQGLAGEGVIGKFERAEDDEPWREGPGGSWPRRISPISPPDAPGA